MKADIANRPGVEPRKPDPKDIKPKQQSSATPVEPAEAAPSSRILGSDVRSEIRTDRTRGF
jgi:hypothetical protein